MKKVLAIAMFGLFAMAVVVPVQAVTVKEVNQVINQEDPPKKTEKKAECDKTAKKETKADCSEAKANKADCDKAKTHANADGSSCCEVKASKGAECSGEKKVVAEAAKAEKKTSGEGRK